MIICHFSSAYSVLCCLFVVAVGRQLVIQQPILDGIDRKIGLAEKKDEIPKEKGIECPAETFKCEGSGRCIPISWRCDSESDCEKGDDELNCSPETHQCNPDKEYQCSVSKHGSMNLPSTSTHLMNLYGAGSLFRHHCIPKAWKCDGEADCINKDDERMCEKIICNNQTQFECLSFDTNSPSCIPKEWVCDGQTDCLSGTDEYACTNRSRSDCDVNTEFQCNDGLCIYKNWRCDADNDCMDGSDEHGCNNDKACEKSGKFKCKTGFCIPNSWKCDGEADCADHSDENDCQTTSLNHTVHCTDKEFKCNNGAQCISSYWKCDGDADCFDESDEKDCGLIKSITCASSQKMCADAKECVDNDVICDGSRDCSDGSDELNCTNTEKPVACNKNLEFQCPNETPQKCILYSNLCKSGILNNDCTIKSVCNTEIVNCNKTVDPYCECRKIGTKGKVCSCLSGLELVADKCTDINECETHGVCHQICKNTFRSYKCDCYPGYKLTVGDQNTNNGHTSIIPHKCRAVGKDPMLLLSNRAAIRQYDIVTNKYHPLISSLESAVAMDFWHKNNTLIWSDVSKEKIMICHIGNKTMLNDISECLEHENVTLIDREIRTPDGLAIDWVHGLLFWTDTGLDTISVFDLNTKKRKTLFKEHLDEPRAIAVDPSAGLIFWTDWGAKARIERAGMNGENRLEIISGDIVRWPNGLAVDILDRRVYWADAKMKLISSCDYWGKDVRAVIHSNQHLRHPFSLAVFEEKLYWTDWDQEGVLTVDKFLGKDVKTLMKGISGPMTVRVYHKQAQPEHTNKCENSDCQHLCLPRAMLTAASKEHETDILGLTYSCSCDVGFQISAANSSICISLETITGTMPLEDPSGLYSPYLLLVIVALVVLILGVVHYRRRPARFSAFQFDNPIYRRTIEDLDAELENPIEDNTLGAISILHVGQSAKQSDSTAKLVIGTRNVITEGNHYTKLGSSMVDVHDSAQYSYDQPSNGNAP